MTKMKKILLVGYFSDQSDLCTYATSFYNTLSRLGYEVERLDYRKNYKYLNNYFIDSALKKRCRQFKPDVIFFLKAETIAWKTIRYLKQNLSAVIINFYPDNPFTFWNGNSNSDVLNALPYIDHFLIWSKKLIPILLAAGARSVLYFPFAFDEAVFNCGQEAENLLEKVYDVSFVGSWDKQRQQWLENLIERVPRINLGIWGNRWTEHLPKASFLRKYIMDKAVYGSDMIKIYKSSKIVLNFIRAQNLDAHNMRTFEIPACKAFMLTQYTNDQANFLFKEKDSVQCFKNEDELAAKIDYFLKNSEIRESFAKNAFDVVQKYTLDKQLTALFRKINF